MRIGIDARELGERPTGVGRHLAGLFSGWQTSARAARHTFVLFAPEHFKQEHIKNAVGAFGTRPPEVRTAAGSGGTWWEQTTLARAANDAQLDVFFAPGYTSPLRLRMPSVLLVHDVSFASHPEWFQSREGLRRRLFTRWAAERAGMILTVSHTARHEIVDTYRLPQDRVRCVYPGVSQLCGDVNPQQTREPILMFAGSIFNRRHVPELIQGFARVQRNHADARLEIVGDNRTHPHQHLESTAAKEGVQHAVAFRAYVPDATLAALYGRARAFAFLSEYEGFGHPPLEALCCGVPAVLLDTPVARETCSDAALYVKCEVSAIANALESVLFDTATRQRLLSAAPAVLARYSWPQAAEHTLDALEAAAAR
jgi:glycosyltransferase involved in cell wall biosynthesis